MAATSKSRSNGRASASAPETQAVETPVTHETQAPVEPADSKFSPESIRFGVMTERGYVPPSHVERVRCSLFEPEIELFVYFNTSVAYGFLNSGYELPGANEVEKTCRRLAMVIKDFEGWNFFDPWKQQAVPKPDQNDWQTYRPLVAANGLLTQLGVWIDGEGLMKALDQSMGN